MCDPRHELALDAAYPFSILLAAFEFLHIALLKTPYLLLHALPLSNVTDDGRGVNPVICFPGTQTDLDRELGTIFPASSEFEALPHGSRDPRLNEARSPFGMHAAMSIWHQNVYSSAYQLLRGVTEQVL